MRKFCTWVPAVCLLASGFCSTTAFSQTFTNADAAVPQPSITYVRDVLPIVLGRCYSCHNNQTKFLPNWSDYPTAFGHRLEIKRRVWDSWKGQYYKQPMPAGNSPQCLAMTEAERRTIKEWVAKGAIYGVPPAPGNPGSKLENIELGRRLFAVTCTPCHQADGQGIPEKFPPLAASDFLNFDKNRAIKTLLNGRQGEIVVNGNRFNNIMPKFPLTDEQIANVLTYVYSSFGNSGKEVTTDEVKTLRAGKDEASTDPKSLPVSKPSSFE